MKIVEVGCIIITSDRSKIIGDAITSALPYVDGFVFVDLGMDKATKDVINSLTENWTSVQDDPANGTGHWRNTGLEHAHQMGYDWALMLDTDERLVVKEPFKDNLKDCPFSALSARHINLSYSKERFFKLPAEGSFSGHSHEAWSGDKTAIIHGVFFDELKKSDARLDDLMKEIQEGLESQVGTDKNDYRWHNYMGLLALAQGDLGEAIRNFHNALLCEASDENKAMTRYHMAKAMCENKLYQSALDMALKGIKLHPGVAENAWIAGVCSLALGEPQKAINWANMAISNGFYCGSEYAWNRLGRLEPYALWEGPFELQRDAMKAMGYHEHIIQNQERLIEEVKRRTL